MALATVAAAQIYECTNAKGGKEYAQSCPPGTVKQRQVVEGGAAGAPAAGGAAGPKAIDQQEIEFRKRFPHVAIAGEEGPGKSQGRGSRA
jgi:hypothetical protein